MTHPSEDHIVGDPAAREGLLNREFETYQEIPLPTSDEERTALADKLATEGVTGIDDIEEEHTVKQRVIID